MNPQTRRFKSHVDKWDSIRNNEYFSFEGVADLLKQARADTRIQGRCCDARYFCCSCAGSRCRSGGVLCLCLTVGSAPGLMMTPPTPLSGFSTPRRADVRLRPDPGARDPGIHSPVPQSRLRGTQS